MRVWESSCLWQTLGLMLICVSKEQIINNLYFFEPEIELNNGYSDFLLLPDKQRFPGAAHSYTLELKCVKPLAGDAEVDAKSREADAQLERYSHDKVAERLCAGTRCLLKVVFRGAGMAVCEETAARDVR